MKLFPLIEKLRDLNNDWQAYFAGGTVPPHSPLMQNPHPVNPWLEEEEKLKQEALEKTCEDAPIGNVKQSNSEISR